MPEPCSGCRKNGSFAVETGSPRAFNKLSGRKNYLRTNKRDEIFELRGSAGEFVTAQDERSRPTTAEEVKLLLAPIIEKKIA